MPCTAPRLPASFREEDLTAAAEEVHDGHSSIDENGGWTDTAENNQTNCDNAERAYSLIMKGKLLRLDEPLKFIFGRHEPRAGRERFSV